MSPWASPIVIVPKKTAPGEPPRRRMCVDYRMLNQLLPKVGKAHSKAKGVLTLVPLPRIDEIYAKLEGSTIYSTFDMRSGYYHLELSSESQPKSAFVIGLHGKCYRIMVLSSVTNSLKWWPKNWGRTQDILTLL